MSQRELLLWNIYEITSESPIQGVHLRSKLRKHMVEQKINLLCDNAQEQELQGGDPIVRFAIIDPAHLSTVLNFLESFLEKVNILLVRENIPNPFLAKLFVND